MFTKTELQGLEASFSKAYPEYHSQLKACKNETELQVAYEKIKQDAYQKAKPYLAVGDDPTGFPTIALTPDMYERLIAASGDSIKIYVTAILNQAQLIQPDFSVGKTVATLIGGGLTAIGSVAAAAFGGGIIGGAVASAAVAAGVTAVTVAGLVTLIAVVIVGIIIPIIYFALKPACCFVLVVNETSKTINWADDYCAHGKAIGHTPFINPAINIPPPIPDSGKYVYTGIVQSSKNDGALVGTQYGFTYAYGANVAGSPKVNFGVECPLTSIWVDNNCYCAIDSSSSNAANETDSKNALSYTASKTPLDVSIKCNSASGYVAYYVARIKDGSIK